MQVLSLIASWIHDNQKTYIEKRQTENGQEKYLEKMKLVIHFVTCTKWKINKSKYKTELNTDSR